MNFIGEGRTLGGRTTLLLNPQYNTHPAATLSTQVNKNATNISAKLLKPKAITTELANTAMP